MAAPIYTIYIQRNNRDITHLVDGFRYEDSVEEDDMVTLTLKSKTAQLVDDEDLQEGQKIIFSFGFRSKQSGKRLAQIQDIEPDFAGQLRVTIKAFDLGLLMKKEERQDLWEDVKASDIVKNIAARNGLKHNVVETSKKYESLPQGNRTDFEFLKYLSEIEEDGSFRFFVKDDVINFNKIDLTQAPKRTYRWRDPNGVVLGFKPRSRGSQKKGGSQETVVTGVDPITGEVFEQKVTNENASDDTKLGDYPVNYNADAIRQSSASEQQTEETKAGKNLVVPAENAEEARNIANSQKKKTAMNDITGELNVEADPFIQSDTIVTLANFGKKYSGNWYVKSVIFIIRNNTVFTATLSLGRNASKLNEVGNPEANKKNNETGPEDGSREKKVKSFVYDEDGNPIGN